MIIDGGRFRELQFIQFGEDEIFSSPFSLSLVQARLIEGTDENYRARSVINL